MCHYFIWYSSSPTDFSFEHRMQFKCQLELKKLHSCGDCWYLMQSQIIELFSSPLTTSFYFSISSCRIKKKQMVERTVYHIVFYRHVTGQNVFLCLKRFPIHHRAQRSYIEYISTDWRIMMSPARPLPPKVKNTSQGGTNSKERNSKKGIYLVFNIHLLIMCIDSRDVQAHETFRIIEASRLGKTSKII